MHPYIRPLYEVVYTSGPDGIRAFRTLSDYRLH